MKLFVFLVAFFISVFIVMLLARHKRFLFILDRPNARSLHQVATPKTGGVAILLSVGLLCPFFIRTIEEAYLVLGFIVLGAISLVNDKRELGIRTRLVVQGSVVLFFLYILDVSFVAGAIYFFSLLWFINLYNFMDGMDGFAGGMTIFGFSGFALVGLLTGVGFSPLFTVVIAATLGFLILNFPKAEIFMGDSGSISLGFLAGAIGVLLIKNQTVSIAFFLVLFSPFIVDASYTLFKRILRREMFWQAHRSHIYQRLALSPLGVTRTLLLQYLLMAACLLSAVAEHYFKLAYPILAIWSILYLLLILFSERYIARHEKAKTVE